MKTFKAMSTQRRINIGGDWNATIIGLAEELRGLADRMRQMNDRKPSDYLKQVAVNYDGAAENVLHSVDSEPFYISVNGFTFGVVEVNDARV